MVNALVWSAWTLSAFLVVYHLFRWWHTYFATKGKDILSPGFATFLGLEYITLGNAFMRVYLDNRPLYQKLTPEGFMHTGLTQAQLLCCAGWAFAVIYVGLKVFQFAREIRHWTIPVLYLIFVLLGTATVLCWVLNISLSEH